MVNSKDFAKRLQLILNFYSISATAFSEEINFNRSTISHLLSGRNKPSLEFVMKVLQKFPEVELYWLLNGNGTFPAQNKTVKQEFKEVPEQIIKENNVENTLFSVVRDEDPVEYKSVVNSNSKIEIDRIIIFYKNGNFKVYEN